MIPVSGCVIRIKGEVKKYQKDPNGRAFYTFKCEHSNKHQLYSKTAQVRIDEYKCNLSLPNDSPLSPHLIDGALIYIEKGWWEISEYEYQGRNVKSNQLRIDSHGVALISTPDNAKQQTPEPQYGQPQQQFRNNQVQQAPPPVAATQPPQYQQPQPQVGTVSPPPAIMPTPMASPPNAAV